MPRNMEEEIAQLKKQLALKDTQLQAALTANTSKSVPQKLIPRPKGQAGKGSGYNLCEVMRLGRCKTRYNRLMRIVRYYVNRFLNVGKTISKQNPARLEQVIILQYLVNNLDKFKCAQRQERAAEAEDPAVWDDDDDDDLSDAGDEDDAANSDEEEANVPLDNDDTVEEEAEENVDYERLDLDAPADLDFEADQLMGLQNIDDILVTSTTTKAKSNIKENIPPLPQTPQTAPPLSAKAKGKQRAPPVSPVLAKPSSKRRLEEKEDTPSIAKKAMKAKRHGWPTEIDFDQLASRVPVLLPELHLLQSETDVLHVSPIWLKFLERIRYQPTWVADSTVILFATQMHDADLLSFGPKGYHIIKAAVQKSDPTYGDDDHALAYSLCSTLFSLVDKTSKMDGIEDESDLIERKQFLEFILIPHIAASLIAQDLNINLQAAVEVLMESGDYGHNVNPYVPAPPKGPSHPPHHRKSVNLKLPPQQIITSDFSEKPKEKKTKQTKSTSNPQPKVEPRKYGTRQAQSTRTALFLCVLTA
ncbi:hypothetical protein B0H13DRAFT_1853537 [Mycena leptocephala]|nr:hypothetical protein B0H13DRAFT_1853537 [Mycena leptocephala]